MRPRQWAKNVLVVAAPVAAGRITDPEVAAWTVFAFVAFTAAAAGTYLVNDVLDREADARHPEKRHRPIASGQVPVGVAVAVGAVLLAAAVLVPFLLGRAPLGWVIVVYVASASAYSLGAKRVALVDVTIVAAGFVLRALAGAFGVGVPVSQWFLIVISFGALYVVATKRYAELRDLGHDPHEKGATRAALQDYSMDTLTEMRFTSAAVTLLAYVLWAFEGAQAAGGGWWFELSIVPFVLAVYRYAVAVHRGDGQAPEEILLADRQLLLYVAAWAALYGTGVYLA